MVKKNIKSQVDLEYTKSDDNRSYHINSNKIKKTLGFKPIKSIEEAIQDLIRAFENKIFTNTLSNEEYFNIKKMQKIDLR